jgi:hypothetical protein
VNPTEELAALSPDLIDDEGALGEWVDGVIRANPLAEARRVEIDQWRGWLRCAADSETYKLVVEIDARVWERWLDLGVVLVRLGFESGREHPLASEKIEGSP